MKKFAWILAAAAMVLLAGCKKDGGNAATEVGKWYGYNTRDSKDDVAYVLDLKADKTADFIISAWGERYQGTYTYDGKVVKLSWNKHLTRPNAMSYLDVYGEYCTRPENLYKHWDDAGLYETSLMEIGFTYSGNTGEIDMANKPCYAERQ